MLRIKWLLIIFLLIATTSFAQNTINIGIPVTFFDAVASSISNSTVFAMPALQVQCTWQSSFSSSPASITLQLQVSNDNISFSTIDTSTSTTGEVRTVNTSAGFIRARIDAVSGGSGITTTIVCRNGGGTSGTLPGGSDTQVQFNNNGNLGGSGGLTFKNTNATGFTGFNTAISSILPNALFSTQAFDIVNGIGSITGAAQTTDTGDGNGARGIQGIAVDGDITGEGGAAGVVGTGIDLSGGGGIGGQFAGFSRISGGTSYGAFFNAYGEADGTISLTGAEIGLNSELPTLAVTNGYGIKIDTPTATHGFTNIYGIKLDNQTIGGATNNFAIDVNGKFQVAPDGSTVTSGYIASGSTPSVANVGANSCGTTAATIAGNDNSGSITVGATSGTQCRITFVSTAPTARECTANDETTTTAVRVTYIDTTHTDFIGAFIAGDKVSYICFAR